jgi:hypothetical protein
VILSETLQAVGERHLIREIVRTIILCEDAEAREREIAALRTLVEYSDPTLDVNQFDGLTRLALQHLQLWGTLTRVRAVGV